jgi:hypothetical protein
VRRRERERVKEREDDILFIFQDVRRKGCGSRVEEWCGVERYVCE